jgi:hypothetical protein
MTDVSLILNRVNNVDEGLASSPIQPNQQYILVHNANDANTDSYIEIYATLDPNASEALPPFSFLKITAFKDGGQEYDVPYEHYQDAMGTSLYKFSFKELIEEGFTLVSINGNVFNSSDDTTTTTSTDFPTLKLINNTGDTLNVTGYIFVEGGIGSYIPPVPNGGSIFLLKTSRPEGINLCSVSNYRLGTIIDGEDKGELSTISTNPYLSYIIPRSIFINANEISVYNVGA